jgi:putative secretion ATPase (PEP-CTERM system associated)
MYEPFYRLSGKPFQLSPDPKFYYESRVHRRAYAFLQYGLYQAEGFLVITGEVGAGKTLLVHNLLAQLDAAQVVAAHLVSTQLDADQLLRAVAAALGLAVTSSDKGVLLVELGQFLRRLGQDQKRALLIVDEAQNLTLRAVEELRMLSNFEAGGKALLQSFLIGQPQLRRTLQVPGMQQFRQRVVASYHLSGLDLHETRAYIEHRLRRVGWAEDPRFEDRAYQTIFAITDGIPRRINLLCNRLLFEGYLNGKHTLGARDVETLATEMREELDGSGRPGELTEARSEQPERSEAAALLHGSAHACSDPPGPSSALRQASGSDEEDPAKLEGRLGRLEQVMTRLLEMLRPRAR